MASAGCFLVLGLTGLAADVKPAEQERHSALGFRKNNIERPLRYTPVGTDFVITNGGEFFNRSLYGGSSAFRVDAGDVPEFSLYLPGRGGNLRLGLRVRGKSKWLHETQEVVAKYRPGMMLYEIRDPLLGRGELRLAVFATRAEEGMIVRADLSGATGVELLFAFGGVDGWRGRRDGDIGCEVEPVTKLFQLRPEQCTSNSVALGKNAFALRGKPGLIGGVISTATTLAVADANDWAKAELLFAAADATTPQPLVRGSLIWA